MTAKLFQPTVSVMHDNAYQTYAELWIKYVFYWFYFWSHAYTKR